MEVIRVESVSHRNGSHFQLSDVSLSINRGEYIGIMGANGAGKTTLLRIICGLIRPQKGRVEISGISAEKIKNIARLIGIVNQHSGLPDLIKVKEFLSYQAKLRNLKKSSIEKFLKLAQLEKYYNVFLSQLSEGNRRKVSIIKALLHDPEIIIMDEPTLGLDPVVKNEIWNFLLNLKKSDTTLIVATNNIEEAKSLCDKVYFLNDGNLTAEFAGEDVGSNNSLYERNLTGGNNNV